MTIVLTYNVNMSPTDASTIAYIILSVLLLVWYVLFAKILI